MDKFEKIKKEIIERAEKISACSDLHKSAYKAETFRELLKGITDNFLHSCQAGIIDIPLLEDIGKDICNDNDLYFNEESSKGYLLVRDATVNATGNAVVSAYVDAMVMAYDNVKVDAWGNAMVMAYDNVKVRAYDNAMVSASGNATVGASGKTTVKAYDNAMVTAASGYVRVRAYDNAMVSAWGNAKVSAWGNAKVGAWGDVTVDAWDSAMVIVHNNTTVNAYNKVTVVAWDYAMVRAWDNAVVKAYYNTVVKASGNAKVSASGNTTVKAYDGATVKASGYATVDAWENTTVVASGNVYINSYNTIEHNISDRVIIRYVHESKVVLGEDTGKGLSMQELMNNKIKEVLKNVDTEGYEYLTIDEDGQLCIHEKEPIFHDQLQGHTNYFLSEEGESKNLTTLDEDDFIFSRDYFYISDFKD